MEPFERTSASARITPKCDERESPIWKSPFPRKIDSEKVVCEKSKTEDWELKSNENRPMSSEMNNNLIGSNSPVKKLDAFLIPTVRQSEPLPLHTRYTWDEWESWNNNTHSHADTLCEDVDKIIQTGNEIRKETQKKLDKVNADSRKWNSDQSLEIHLKKNEVFSEHKALLDENKKLVELQNLIDEVLTKLELSLEISKHCLFERDKRDGIDSARDSVEKELLFEVDIIENYQVMFQDSTKLIAKQQVYNRNAIHQIEVDAIEKEKYLHDTELQANMAEFGNEAADQGAWLKSATAAIERCRNEIMPCKTLSDSLDALIDDTCKQMLRSWNTTNKAIAERINETEEAKMKLKRQLDSINYRIYSLQGCMEDIHRAIDSKRVVIDELKSDLKDDLCTSGNYLEQLHRIKSTLEEDIAIKNNTLFIDREKVRPMRKTFPFISVCGIRVKMQPDISNSKL